MSWAPTATRSPWWRSWVSSRPGARFVGELTLQNKIADTSYDLSFNGTGGAAGFGKGAASVALRDAPDGTTLVYQVKAQVGGKLAQVGARVIDSVARKMADEFFQRLDTVVTGADAQAAARPAEAPADAGPGAPDDASRSASSASSSRAWIYAAAAATVAVVVAFAFGGGGA